MRAGRFDLVTKHVPCANRCVIRADGGVVGAQITRQKSESRVHGKNTSLENEVKQEEI
jgi:hypothetical protein